MRELLKNKAGFTIVEVIIATVILVMSLLGGVVCFSANRKNLAYANLQRLATWNAIYNMERLKSADYAGLTSGTTTENIFLSGKPFQRRTTIQNIGGGPDYKQVTVAMDWGSGTFPLSLTTYISAR